MIKRHIKEVIDYSIKHFPCTILTGPRQVGKSTTVDMLFSERFKSVTLDDVNERELALSNPKGFLEVHPWPLIIDEVQDYTPLQLKMHCCR